MPVPQPTPIFRFIHVGNLHIYLHRGGMHAPNFTPADGLIYKTIHNEDIQRTRRVTKITCGPRGVIHDYVSFYFGYLSPMMYQLKTGWLQGYDEGQEPLIYLISTCQTIHDSGAAYVFSDGHGIAAMTHWYDDLSALGQVVDWDMVYQRYWRDNINDMDRQRRKQAEFLVNEFCDWALVQKIAVINVDVQKRVQDIMAAFPQAQRPPIVIKPEWYYCK